MDCPMQIAFVCTGLTTMRIVSLAGQENLVRCPDTRTFLGMLHHLNSPDDEDADPPELPEKLAAKSLFNWQVGLHPHLAACTTN